MHKKEFVRNAKQGFLLGSFILIASNIIVKIIGALYKIPLHRLIGDEGMGYFSTAYNFYSLLLTFSTIGPPAAISAMISAAYAKKDSNTVIRIFKISLALFFAVGFMTSFGLLMLSGKAAALIGNRNAALSIAAITPAVFFMCIVSVMRGYFQGLSNMVPTAVSQLVEAICKLALGLGIAAFLRYKGYPVYVIAAGTISGISAGTLLSAAYLVICKKKHKIKTELNKKALSGRYIMRALLTAALPITISSCVMSLTRFIDNYFILSRLRDIGYTAQSANIAYGNYEALVVTIFSAPAAIVSSVAVAVIPAVSSAIVLENKTLLQKNIESSLRISNIIAMPAGALFMLMPYQILSILYNEKSALTASGLLKISGISAVLITLVTLTASIIQAAGKSHLPLISTLVGCAVKTVSGYLMLGSRKFGIRGAAISTLLCYCVIFSINIICLLKIARVKIMISNTFIKPFLCAAGMSVTAKCTFNLLSLKSGSKAVTVFSLIFAGMLYMVLISVSGTITVSDLRGMKISDKIISRLMKIGVIKNDRNYGYKRKNKNASR